jgi:hypothetical protein
MYDYYHLMFNMLDNVGYLKKIIKYAELSCFERMSVDDFLLLSNEYKEKIYSNHKKFKSLTLVEIQFLKWSQRNIDIVNYLTQIRSHIINIEESMWNIYVCKLIKYIYNCNPTLLPERKYGVNAIIEVNGDRIAIRIRKRSRKSQDMKSVQELVSGATAHGCSKKLLIGNLYGNSITLAKRNDCCVINYYDKHFLDLVQMYEVSINNNLFYDCDLLNIDYDNYYGSISCELNRHFNIAEKWFCMKIKNLNK